MKSKKEAQSMDHNNYDELITLEEFCDMLSIGKSTAYNLLNTGTIKAFKIGRIWKIPRQSVIDYIYGQINP